MHDNRLQYCMLVYYYSTMFSIMVYLWVVKSYLEGKHDIYYKQLCIRNFS